MAFSDTIAAVESDLDKIAVGPYCVYERLYPPRGGSWTTQDSRPLSPSTTAKMENPLMTSDYPFNSGASAPWMVSSTDDPSLGAHHADMFPQANWEDWMRWDSANQTLSPKSLNANGPLCYMRPESKAAMFNRRHHPQYAEPSADLHSNGTSGPSITTATSAPFTFGEANSHPTMFQFGNSSMNSPITELPPNHGLPSDRVIWSQKQPFDHSESASCSPPPLDPQQLSDAPLPPQSTPSLRHSPSSGTNLRTSSLSSSRSSPEPVPQKVGNSKKRKSLTTDDESVGSKNGKQPPVKKTAHNMIEKRYRTNLNDKIAALRDSVPSLRVMSRSGGNGEDEDDGEDLEGLTPAHKLNKATVLSKATEYIRHLEKRNKRLTDELSAVKVRMEAYDKLAMAAPMPMGNAVSTPDGIRFQEDPFAASAAQCAQTTQAAPQGMIPVPESIMNLHRAAVNQPHYAPQQHQYPVYTNAPARPGVPGPPMVNGRRNNGLVSKLMVGSLAGLMIMEGLSEREKSAEDTSGRGLFAIPVHLAGHTGSSMVSRLSMLGMSPSQGILPLLKACLVLGALIYLIAPLLDLKPKAKKKVPSTLLSPVPSLASPVEVRRKAWLTAIQTVWVPQHNFLLEAAALILKTLKLSTRKLVGWHGYALLTGLSREQEAARVKAWEIALDAQLMGGDAEISLSRLVLTLMASGTLPDTPARLMLKALHIRVLLWEVAKAGYGTWYLFEDLSAKLARSYWNAARNEHKMLLSKPSEGIDQPESLSEHLAALLEMECDDVLINNIIQRAYNVAWNKPSAENLEPHETMDRVVEDFAISSPLDALAAWWSCLSLKRTKIRFLDSGGTAPKEVIEADLDMAVATAPPNSGASIRALVARAVLLDDNRETHIAAALHALPAHSVPAPTNGPASPTRALLMNAIGDSPVPTDVRTSLTLAKCLSLASQSHDSPLPDEARARAASVLNAYHFSNAGFTLLSFVAAYKVLTTFAADEALLAETRAGLERLASALRVWIGREAGRRSGVHTRTRAAVVERCLDISKMLVGMREALVEEQGEESDAGYVSQSEGEEGV